MPTLSNVQLLPSAPPNSQVVVATPSAGGGEVFGRLSLDLVMASGGAAAVTTQTILSKIGYTPYDAANPVGYQTAAQVAALVATAGIVPVTAIAASGAAQTLTAPANGDIAYDITLTGNCVLTLAGGTAGQEQTIKLYLRQDSAAGHMPTLPPNVRWPGGTAPTPNTAAGFIDRFSFTTPDAGTTWFGSYAE